MMWAALSVTTQLLSPALEKVAGDTGRKLTSEPVGCLPQPTGLTGPVPAG